MNLVTLEGNLRDKFGFTISYRDVLSAAMYPKVRRAAAWVVERCTAWCLCSV